MNVVKNNFTLPLKVFLLLIFLSSCSLSQVINKAENQKFSLEPNLLERFGDSVRFNLKVRLPHQTLTKQAVYRLGTEFRYEDQVYAFEKDLAVKGDTLDPYSPVEMKGSFSMPYREGMESGRLVAFGEISRRNRIKGKTSDVFVTRGIATTPSLSQIGQYYLDENIPFLGLYVKYADPSAYGMFSEGWQGFQQLLMSYSNLSYLEKTKYMDLVNGPGDIAFKLYKMAELPGYPLVRRDILPAFETYRKKPNSPSINKTELELSILSRRIRIGEVAPSALSEAGYAKIIEMEPGWQEKEILLKAQVEAHPSGSAFNNLGVIYLNQANRVLEKEEKNLLLQKAMNAFEKSNSYFQNPYAVYNLGLVYWMLEDKISAYNTFYRAMAISMSDELRQVHEAALGAVSNFNGDYRLAAIHLNKAEKNAINLFNQGLANLMAQDYHNALIKFEESALQDMRNGYPFYGIAVVAARNGQEMVLFENLEKAVSRSGFLKKRAPLDREFFDYHEKEGFKEALR